MPSWDDGSSSSQAYLDDMTALDYAPDRVDDPTFCGIAVGCPELCRVHRLEPRKCVAFDGTNTGRKFYLCQIENEVLNCGFQSWVDEEWPDTLKNSLSKLWDMYNTVSTEMINGNVEHDKVVEDLKAEKNKMQKKYSDLMADVNNFVKATEQRVVAAHMARIKAESEHNAPCLHLKEKAALLEMEEERDKLKQEVEMLKNLKKAQADIMKAKQAEWEAEKKGLKEGKKKAEYSLFDLFKARHAEKCKLDRIKAILQEE